MSSKITYIIILLALLFVFLCVFSNSMLKPLSRDEHMYCTAAVLMSQGKTIYKDFSYVAQLPYHPLLYAAVYKITNTTHFLLTGRVISVICDILIVFFLIAIYRQIFCFHPFTRCSNIGRCNIFLVIHHNQLQRQSRSLAAFHHRRNSDIRNLYADNNCFDFACVFYLYTG